MAYLRLSPAVFNSSSMNNVSLSLCISTYRGVTTKNRELVAKVVILICSAAASGVTFCTYMQVYFSWPFN